jgi:nucleotide-binding universal stress UspA family protein
LDSLWKGDSIGGWEARLPFYFSRSRPLMRMRARSQVSEVRHEEFAGCRRFFVDTAERMARAFGAKIWLLHVVPEVPPVASLGEVPFQWPAIDAELPERFPEEQHQMQTLLFGLKDKGLNAETLLIRGSAVVEILAIAEQYAIDMIIMGSHGHGAWYELVVGTVSEGVLHRAPCPTLIVPSEKQQKRAAVRHRETPAATPH